jgi:hypothetical protein
LEILSASLCLLNLGIRSATPSTIIISKKNPAIDIPTTCLVVKIFFFFTEFDSSVADGPSACLPGVRSAGPQNGGAGDAGGGGGGGFNGDVDGASGAVVALNGFPSFLHRKLSILVNMCKLTSIKKELCFLFC